MKALASITRTQWLILIVLELIGICMYWGVIPWLIVAANAAPPPSVEIVAAAPSTETALPKTTPTKQPATPTRSSTPTRAPTGTYTPIATVAPTDAPTLTSPPTLTTSPAATPAPTETTTPTPPSVVTKIPASVFVNLLLNPRAGLASQTAFFTSACFGDNANPLQDRDYMTPADWSGALDRKCFFGYNVNPVDRMPRKRYTAGGGPDGQPHFYIVPPDAFAKDTQSIKLLSQMHLIVDTDQGCAALGEIGATADGANYQCAACDFLRAGGVCPAMDGSAKSIVLPTNQNNLIDASSSGGAYGFQAFPLVIFKKGFSLYFTGRSGYAPPRVWFESTIDTLAANINPRTTAELSDQQVRDLAAQYDRAQTGSDPLTRLAAVEREAQVTSASPITLKSRQEGAISFAAKPGTVLSSIAWRITPQNNIDKREFLETNLCLDSGGETTCFTGVEDFAHCAFFTPCVTGYSRLTPVDHGGYIATRYFPAGHAPLLRDGKIVARFQAPDIGTVLEIQVMIRVREVDPALVGNLNMP